MGQLPFRPLQANGWSDYEEDWLSPELLFRRIGVLNKIKDKWKFKHIDNEYLNEILKRNFDNSKEIISFLKNIDNDEKIIALFSSKWMLKT